MKKIVLSLAGVLAATAFAPEAAAIPAFARQTGMACSACHQQHYPVLNAFGRAYKAGAYTMMGAQGKVEGDHLSIPDTLNLSMLIKLRYDDQGGNPAAGKNAGTGVGIDRSNGEWQFGEEFVMLGGGRVAENAGWFGEFILNGGSSTTGITGILRLPFAYDVGSVKLSVVPFTADGGGAHVGYEMSSGGTLRANRWSEQRKDVSAVQYTLADGNGSNAAWGGAATGFAFAAQNDMGYIAWTRFSPNHMMSGNGRAIPSFDMNSNLFRVAVTPSYNDWAFHVGAGILTGTSELSGAGTVGVVNSGMLDARGHFFDGQAHGKLGGKDVGFYASYAKAPVVSGNCTGATAAVAGVNQAGGCNLFNNGVLDKWSWALGVDYSIIPHTLHLGAAYRDARKGTITAGGNTTDKSTMIQAVYDLYQNVALHAIYSARTGSAYSAVGAQGRNETMFMLESAW